MQRCLLGPSRPRPATYSPCLWTRYTRVCTEGETRLSINDITIAIEIGEADGRIASTLVLSWLQLVQLDHPISISLRSTSLSILPLLVYLEQSSKHSALLTTTTTTITIMAGTRRSARVASSQGSQQESSPSSQTSPNATNKKRKAESGSSPTAKRGKQAPKQQQTIEESMDVDTYAAFLIFFDAC